MLAGTRLRWIDGGEKVRSKEQVALKPNMEIKIIFDDGNEDSAPISQIAELKHIK